MPEYMHEVVRDWPSVERMNLKYFSIMLLATSAIAVSKQVSAMDSSPQCVEVVTKEAEREKAPSTQTVKCAYDFDEFVSRLAAFSSNRSIPTVVENVQIAFELPQLATSYVTEHHASYRVDVTGTGGWRVLISIDESFIPNLDTGDRGPPRFMPGPYPRRLYDLQVPNTGVSLRAHIAVIGRNPALGPPECIPIRPLFDALANANWKELILPFPHGVPISYAYESGDKRVAFDGRTTMCALTVSILQGKK